MNSRPDPDEILKQIQAEESSRGRLKIFLGYAAGVGKTYAMLEAAHQRQQQGVDAVVGYVETHGRADTEALVNGLEVLPCKQVEYHDIKLSELDVDAVITRHPQLVLIDEFAHTNAPGSKHPKRYMDVDDILYAGIDVYTTLNVQHLESMNDVVAQVTSVVVRETVPDRVLDEASEIEVIDLPPDELLTRLKEGKVYIPEQAQRAVEKFFRKGNLSALRELSLRRAAERVDTQMRDYMRTRSIQGPWAVS
jgi:two-component system sensor histidine kinase KdpD